MGQRSRTFAAHLTSPTQSGAGPGSLEKMNKLYRVWRVWGLGLGSLKFQDPSRCLLLPSL